MVYDTFIDLGKEFNDLVSTAPLTLNLKSGPWSPKDYSKAKQDKITLKQALQKSKNIPLIRVAKEIGFEKLEEQLGPRIPHLRRPLAEYPSQLLGAIELSLEEVFLVYKEFIDRKCEEIRTGAREFENSSLYFMSMADKTTISRLAAGALRNANVFGKTGTSNNGLDNWYFAFDGNNYYVIWFGVDSKRDGVNMRVSGASTAFLIFQDFMNKRGKQISEIMCE